MAACPPGHAAEYLSIVEIDSYWTRNGGAGSKRVIAVAVALAESAGDRYAKSPACALGLWQILYIHADESGFDAVQYYNPDRNAAAAVYLSSNGIDWGAWDVAYAAGESLTTRYPIFIPERGSVAYQRMPEVAAALGLQDPSGQAPSAPVGPVTPGQVGPLPGVGPGGGTGTTPGGGSAVVPATHPQYVPSGYIYPPGSTGSGWDDLRQLWGSDQRELQQLLVGLRVRLQTIFSGG